MNLRSMPFRAGLAEPSARRPARATLLVALACLASGAQALQPLITDDTGTQGRGGHQLEVPYARERAASGGANDRADSLELVYTYGLTESLDLFVAAGHARLRTGTKTSGTTNPTVGAKWRIHENDASGTSLGLKPELLLPVSAARESAGLGTGRTSARLTFIVTQEVPFGAVHFNVGAGRDRFRDPAANPDVRTTGASLAPVWDVTERWKLALDVGVESARAAGATVRTRYAELGVIYAAGKDLEWALGAIRTRDDASPRTTTTTLTAGLTWRF